MLKALDIKEEPGGEQITFSMVFIQKDGQRVFVPGGVAVGLPYSLTVNMLRGVLPIDAAGNKAGYVYPVCIDNILDIIGRTGVLNTGLKYIRNFTMGQGIFPVKVTGYNDKGNEFLSVINDPKITSFLEGRVVRRYMANTLRDYFKVGISYAELIANTDGSQMVGINTINAQHCRLTEAENGVIKNCVIHGNSPDAPVSGFKVLPVLDNYDPAADLLNLRVAGKTMGKSFVHLVRDEWGNEDYYPLPAWWSAYRARLIDIANQVPTFLKRAYANQISWLWHIKIPYAYWDKRYPKNQYKDEPARMRMIQNDMYEIEKSVIPPMNDFSLKVVRLLKRNTYSLKSTSIVPALSVCGAREKRRDFTNGFLFKGFCGSGGKPSR